MLTQPMIEESGAINDLAELIAHSEELGQTFPSRDIWWRGENANGWRLIPSTYRDGRDWNWEHSASTYFRLKAGTRYHKCPLQNDLPGWLFLMQHYRLPTRLLDWTESSLVAAFFAVEGLAEPQRHGVVWALNPLALNQRQIGMARFAAGGHPLVAPLFLLPSSTLHSWTEPSRLFRTKPTPAC
jgi:FRG domain